MSASIIASRAIVKFVEAHKKDLLRLFLFCVDVYTSFYVTASFIFPSAILLYIGGHLAVPPFHPSQANPEMDLSWLL